MEKHGVARRGKGRHRRDHAAKHAVLVANVRGLKAAHAVASGMPVND